jgi:hypothetical protein
MEASDQLYAPAMLLLGKGPSVSIGKEVGRTPELVWTLPNREKSLARAGNQTQAVCHQCYVYSKVYKKVESLFRTCSANKNI